MNVRAQFRCHSVAALDPGESNNPASRVILQAVYGRGVENAAWSRATPNAYLDMTITNPDAIGAFVPGQAYWVDFSPVEPPAADPAPAMDAVTTFDGGRRASDRLTEAALG